MRITNPMVTRNYTKGLHTNRGLLDRYSGQVMDGRKFYSMSEDTSSGVRAMQVRRNLSRIDAYLDNTSAAKSFYTAAETSLSFVRNIILQADCMNACDQEQDNQKCDNMHDQTPNLPDGYFRRRRI